MANWADRVTSYFYLQAAKQWNDMAAQMELLEREPVYRIIRSREK
ncbi:hypothetical protein Q2941_46245 [Bradyrhizobium sp. UFLA05-153]